MNYRLRAYSLQDIGQREDQQDCFYPAFKDPCQFSEVDRDMVYYEGVPHTDDRLFILCDGMGGHDSGEVASQIVTYAMSKELIKSSTLEGTFDDRLIVEAAEAAHKALIESKDGADNMGTTMAVLKFHSGGATVGHVGDSRVYQFRPAKGEEPARVLFCTNDHHLEDRPNMLTRAFLAYEKKVPEVEIDHITDIKPGDIFMLCSDGIVENLSSEELCKLVTNPNYGDTERVQRLLLECKDHTDNHTATIIRIKDVINGEDALYQDLPLSEGTVLDSQNYTYHIDKVLGSGSFGITYLASIHLAMKGQMGAIHTEVKVCLKEFAMEGYMERKGSGLHIIRDEESVKLYEGKFRREATKLAMLSHPNIVRILEVFEANGTVYFSMEYLPDGDLSSYACSKAGLPEKKAIPFIRQIGSALSYIHANKMLHLDVKPENVMMMGENNVKLIDFGIAIDYDKWGDSEMENGKGVGTRGFAPIEQLDRERKMEFLPAIDVYALGATYYKILAAYNPNNAYDVKKNGLDLHPLQTKGVSKKSIEAIKAAMEPDVEKRLQSVDEFLAMLPSIDNESDFARAKKKLDFPWKTILVVLAMIACFILMGLAAVKSQAATPTKFLDEGVSLELMQHRKATISNLKYKLFFSIPSNKQKAVEGKETIEFSLLKKDSVIIDFREKVDKIHSVRVNGKDCAWYFKDEHIVIPESATCKGENRVKIDFTAGNQSLNRRDDYVYTLFVPDRARTVFPCFEQPNLKALFTLSLEVPQEWKAVTNTYQKEENVKDGRKTILFAETEPLSTYLFAFAAGNFQYGTYTKDGRTIGAYYRETDPKRIAQLPDIFKQVMFALDWQEKFTTVQYPFAKYDFVVLPGFQFGGMEHTGCTFYNDNTLFLPENPTPDDQLRRTELISHETSHMWFGDAVTMDWFNDVWTKEVFANYFAAEITEPLFPELDHKLNWLRTYQGAAISQDRTEGRTSIRQDLDNMRNAGLVYNNIIYNKAPVMMRKMVALMGKDAYQRGIQKYVKKYKYSNATWDDLVSMLDAETKVDLQSFSKDWVDTPNWPVRKAVSYRDASDIDFYGYTALSESQTDSLVADMPKGGAEQMAALMTLYENYLNKTIPTDKFVRIVIDKINSSTDPLVCSYLLGRLSEPMLEMRNADVEKAVWKIHKSHPLLSVRTQALRQLISSGFSAATTDSLYNIWEQAKCKGLSVYDYMRLAYELSVRMPEKAEGIIAKQRSRLTNPDRLSQFDFIARAVNPSEGYRDELFQSLSKPENRRIEPWTLSVLYYLNHPLREQASVKYIRPALSWLTDVQRTGDIFFPGNWCSNLLAGHRSKEAYREVEAFLKGSPEMIPLMKNKILSAEYLLKRAQ